MNQISALSNCVEYDATCDSPNANGDSSDPATVKDVTVSGTVGKEQAEAIEKIVNKYYERKTRFLAFMAILEHQPKRLPEFLSRMLAQQSDF